MAVILFIVVEQEGACVLRLPFEKFLIGQEFAAGLPESFAEIAERNITICKKSCQILI